MDEHKVGLKWPHAVTKKPNREFLAPYILTSIIRPMGDSNATNKHNMHIKNVITSIGCVRSPKHIFGGKYSNETT